MYVKIHLFYCTSHKIAVLHRCIRNGSHIIRAVKEHSIVMSKICLASFGMFLIVSNAACICSAFVPNQLTLTNTLSTGRGNILLLSADATSASNSASDELFHRSLLEHRLKNQRSRGGRPPNVTAEKKRKVANRNANTIYVGNLSYGELSSTVDGPIFIIVQILLLISLYLWFFCFLLIRRNRGTDSRALRAPRVHNASLYAHGSGHWQVSWLCFPRNEQPLRDGARLRGGASN